MGKGGFVRDGDKKRAVDRGKALDRHQKDGFFVQAPLRGQQGDPAAF